MKQATIKFEKIRGIDGEVEGYKCQEGYYIMKHYTWGNNYEWVINKDGDQFYPAHQIYDLQESGEIIICDTLKQAKAKVLKLIEEEQQQEQEEIQEPKAENIINNIKFDYEEAFNQNKLFSKDHVKYLGYLEYNKNSFNFTYQCNPKYTKPNKKDCLACLLTDYYSYKFVKDMADFLIEFGYNENEDALRCGISAYGACKETYRKLNKLFNNEEIELLNEYFKDY